MPNMRIVYTNKADYATLTASATAGSLVASNLQTDLKSEIWRSTATSATLTLTWTAAETVSCVALPFCNLTSTATIQVQGFTEVADVTPVIDSGAVLACPSAYGYSADLKVTTGVNSFAYGGATCADVWITPTVVKKIVITITDTNNTAGYIEAGRLVVGKYWSPDYNVENEGVKVTFQEDSKHERSDAGELRTDRGPIYRRLAFDLNVMSSSDRNYIWRIVVGNGMSKAVYISLIPDSTDVFDESVHSMYGRLSSSTTIQYKLLGRHATSLQFDEL